MSRTVLFGTHRENSTVPRRSLPTLLLLSKPKMTRTEFVIKKSVRRRRRRLFFLLHYRPERVAMKYYEGVVCSNICIYTGRVCEEKYLNDGLQ